MVKRYVATPEVPSTEIVAQSILLSAFKENVELLTGTRGESDFASMAIVRGDLTVNQVGQQEMINVNRSSVVEPANTAAAASAATINDLRNDVQVLANDLFTTRQALDLLIRNLTGAQYGRRNWIRRRQH